MSQQETGNGNEMRCEVSGCEGNDGGKGQFILRCLRKGVQKPFKSTPALLKTDGCTSSSPRVLACLVLTLFADWLKLTGVATFNNIHPLPRTLLA